MNEYRRLTRTAVLLLVSVDGNFYIGKIIDNNKGLIDCLAHYTWTATTSKDTKRTELTANVNNTTVKIEKAIISFYECGHIKSDSCQGYEIHHRSYLWDCRRQFLKKMLKESHNTWHKQYTRKSHKLDFVIDAKAKTIPILKLT